jgi:hypothetical protein
MNFGTTGVAAPNATSSSIARYSRTARFAASGSRFVGPRQRHKLGIEAGDPIIEHLPFFAKIADQLANARAQRVTLENQIRGLAVVFGVRLPAPRCAARHDLRPGDRAWGVRHQSFRSEGENALAGNSGGNRETSPASVVGFCRFMVARGRDGRADARRE